MDNRRVMKAYRDRSGQYQTSGGLFSRVKRYFSGSAAPDPQIRTVSAATAPKRNATAHEPAALHSNTLLADLSRSILSTSVVPAADSGDSNRILSTFFQEKGGKPLTDVEYEGVMSLLERSKASITLPLPDLTPKKPEALEASNRANTNARNANTTNNALNAIGHSNPNNTMNQANVTVGPYSQTKLRNSSMYLNNSSFAVSDYKPQYHTFNESSSRANMSMKRVYQFSGLPSPYRTRIKAPNLAARKLRRVTPVISRPEAMDAAANKTANASTNTADNKTANNTLDAQSSFRPKSKTANALLSVLDGKNESGAEIDIQLETGEEDTRRPLHNPYFRPKRRQITRHPVTSMTAADISSTILHNKAEEIKPADSKGASLFENLDGGKEVKNSEEETKKPEKSEKIELIEKAEYGKEPGSGKASNSFSFGTKATSPAKPPAFGFSAGALEQNDVPKSTFTFKPAEKSNAGATSPEKSSGFTFSAPKTVEKEKPAEKQPDKPIAFGFGNGSAADNKTSQSLFGAAETLNKPMFGAAKGDSSSDASSGSAPAPAKTFSFGTKQTLKPFSFGEKAETKETQPESSSAAAKPVILFGETKSTKPVIFGQNSGQTTKPVMFGQNSGQSTQPAPSSAPKFSFGTQSNGTGFKFGADNGARAAESTNPSDAKPAFSFGANGVSAKARESNGAGNYALAEFTFPEITRIQGTVDEKKVKSYEGLFKF